VSDRDAELLRPTRHVIALEDAEGESLAISGA
jgi:hypothetical protein